MLVSEVIERTYNEFLYPAGINRPTYDKLSAALNSTDVTFTVTGRLQGSIPRDSVLEIDSELMLVDSISGTTVNLHPTLGRGYLETAAATHAQYAPVLIDPTFSRKALFDAIQTIIGTLYPQGLYGRGITTTTTFSYANPTIDIPGATTVLAITARSNLSGPVRWNTLRKGIDYIELLDFSAPKVELLRGGVEGGAMQIIYKADFTIPTAESDELNSLTVPVPERLQRYFPLAVAGYLLQGREVPRVQIEEIKRRLAAEGIQVGSALNIGNQMLNMFYLRYVAPEAARLREQDLSGIEIVRR